MDLDTFTRLSRKTDYFSRLLRRSQYSPRFTDVSYGSLPDPPSASGGGFKGVSAGIRPNFNQPWQGDMTFPTLGAAASAVAGAARSGSRAQRRKSAATGTQSGRGRQQGNQQGNPPQSGGPQQGPLPRGGSVIGGKVVHTTMLGFPTDAPDPRRDPRGQGAPTSRQKRKMANLLKNPKTGASFMEDLQASQAATASRFGSPPITLNDRPRGNPFTDTDIDIGVGSVRTVSREDATAKRFAAQDQRLESTTELNAGGIRVPIRDLADEQRQLEQRDREQEARTSAANISTPQETVTLASGRTISLNRSIGAPQQESQEEQEPKGFLSSYGVQDEEPPASKASSSDAARKVVRLAVAEGRPIPKSLRGMFPDLENVAESPQVNQPNFGTPQQRRLKTQQQTSATPESVAARMARLRGLEVAPGEGATTPIETVSPVGRPRQTIRGMSGAVKNIIKMSEEAQSRNAENM